MDSVCSFVMYMTCAGIHRNEETKPYTPSVSRHGTTRNLQSHIPQGSTASIGLVPNLGRSCCGKFSEYAQLAIPNQGFPLLLLVSGSLEAFSSNPPMLLSLGLNDKNKPNNARGRCSQYQRRRSAVLRPPERFTERCVGQNMT